jgi:hypothetical protein
VPTYRKRRRCSRVEFQNLFSQLQGDGAVLKLPLLQSLIHLRSVAGDSCHAEFRRYGPNRIKLTECAIKVIPHYVSDRGPQAHLRPCAKSARLARRPRGVRSYGVAKGITWVT